MNASYLRRDHHPQRHRARHHRRVRRGHADARGRLAAHRHRARRPARRPRRPRPGTGGTRGGAAGPREPARRDPRDPRGRRRGRARPARLPARRTRLHRRPGDHEAAAHEHLPADPQADPPRPPRRPAAHRGHRQPVPRARRGAPRPAGVAVPLRDRARHHGGRGPRRRAGGSTTRTRTGGRGCSPSPTWPRSRCSCSARGSACPGSPNGSTRPPPCSRPAGGSRSPALLGPFTSPMPQVLGVGALLLAVPWWAHRRRRARARVQRALAAWPDISKAIGLPGSKIQSATVDLWGWRARVRLARGQTIADVTARIPAIESALGTYRGAVRVYPTGDGKANRCELRVLDTDPHAEAIPLARAVRPVDHRAGRPRPVRGRRAVPRVVPAPARAVRRHHRVGQERRTQRPHGHPGRLRRRGHLGHRPQERAWNCSPGHRASTGSPPRPRRPPRCSPTRSRSCRHAPRTWPRPAGESGNRPRTCPRW